MKKKILCSILIACLLIPCLFMLSACKDANDNSNKNLATSFCLLQQNETLNIGTTEKLKNYQDTKTEQYYITCPISATVTLRRSPYYDDYYDCVRYDDGLWYRWELNQTTDNFLIGNKTIITTKTYSYLVYGQETNNLVVRSTTKTETKYDFTTKEFSKPCNITYYLNGYFDSIQTLQELFPELYSLLEISENNKFYIETPKITYQYSENTYKDTYFYFT